MATISDIDDGKGRVLTGAPGESNTILGLGGDDHLVGQELQDLLYGGLGNDSFEAGAGSDFMWGEKGADTVEFRGYASDDDYFMDFKAREGDKVDLRALNIASLDTVKALASITDAGLAIGWGQNPDLVGALTLSGVKRIKDIKTSWFVFDADKTNDDITLDDDGNYFAGGYGNDTIFGGTGDDVIFGEQGNDTIYAGGGSRDHIYGGEGADAIFVDNSLGGYVDGGKGVDILTLHGGTALVDRSFTIDFAKGLLQTVQGDGTRILEFDNIEVFALKYSASFITPGFEIFGSEDVDCFTFEYDGTPNYAIDITVHASAGADIVDIGYGANVTLVYDRRVKLDLSDPSKSSNDAKDDAVRIHADNYLAYHLSAANDVFIGGDRGAWIVGNGGDDSITGSSALDIIVGGEGADILNGGGGKDIYFFEALTDSTNKRPDRITYQQGVDRLVFAIDAIPATPDEDDGFALVDMFTGVAGQMQWDHLIIKGKKETWLEADVNGDAKPDMTIILEGHITITADDFTAL